MTNLVVLQAHATCDDANAPQYCAFQVDDAFIERITALTSLCQQHELSQVNITCHPELWGPVGTEEESRLQCGELIVTHSGQFWFSDSPKNSNGFFESEPINVAGLKSLLAASNFSKVVFANGEIRDIWDEDQPTLQVF